MKKYVLVLVSSVLLFGCTSNHRVYNVQDVPISMTRSGESVSIDTIERAILAGSQKSGWSSRILRTGLIEATILVRTHRATVEIPYNKNTYSINYKNSTNLDYNNGEIHRNYNNWVIRLSKAIQNELDVAKKN